MGGGGLEEVGGGGEGEVRPASGRQEPNQEVFLSRVSAAAEKSGRYKLEAATGGCAMTAGWK